MSKLTNTELREDCEAVIRECGDDNCTAPHHQFARALLSRLDREAEAERKNADEREDFIRLATEAHERAERAIGLMLKSQREKCEVERRLKVAREAIINGPHDATCQFLLNWKLSKHAPGPWECSCWKSRALAGIAPAAPEGEKP